MKNFCNRLRRNNMFCNMYYKRMSAIALAVILCVGFVLSLCTGFSFSNDLQSVYAAENDIKFDNTNVLDDLKSSTISGKPFDITKYPFNESGSSKLEIVNFVEYCYTYRINNQSNFGLYLYIYNPSGINIDTRSRGNKIQIAVGYGADGTPNNYEKFDLQFCSKSEESSYKNLFYKFKVIDRRSTTDNKYIIERVNSHERRYDVSGFELVTYGQSNATDYTVGGTYKFTGYSKGYGADINVESNLASSVNELETVSLDVRSTFFRTESSSLGKGHQNQLNSVYFSVPNDLLEKYGKLQKIKAEWYEYKTQPIVITNKDIIYNKFLPHVGKTINNYDSSIGVYMHDDRQINAGSSTVNYDWIYNVKLAVGDTYKSRSNFLPYWFKSDSNDLKDYVLSSDKLREYINTYNKSNNSGMLPIKDNSINADLFESTVDTGRVRGYNSHNIDSNDLFDMLSYDAGGNSWWDKLKDYGLWSPNTSVSYEDVSPIYEVKPTDIFKPNSELASSLYIYNDDVADFKEYQVTEAAKDKTTFLFRFAQTDYYATNLYIWDADNDFWVCLAKDGMLAQETVFFDFDILQLTFNRDGIYKVIPAVSSPIDIIGAITPPVDAEKGWLQYLIMIVGLLLVAIILAPLLPFIIRIIVWIVTLPFKAIAGLLKMFKKGGKS